MPKLRDLLPGLAVLLGTAGVAAHAWRTAPDFPRHVLEGDFWRAVDRAGSVMVASFVP